MSRSSESFHVRSAGRAYGVMAAACALVLAVGLALPLALASSVPPSTGAGAADSGPVRVSGGSSRPDGAGSAPARPDLTGNISTRTQGVSGQAVKVGIVLLDLSATESLGLGLPNFGVDLQRAMFRALIDQANAAGGIDGRRIEPVYAVNDPLQTAGPHSPRGICLNLANDQKVFAIMGYADAAGECATRQYGLPVVNATGRLDQTYTGSNNLFVSVGESLQRFGRTLAGALVRTRMVDGHKLGIFTVADGGNSELASDTTADALKALGHPVTVLGKSDPGNLNVVPTLVQKMRSAGVDTVLLTSDFATAVRFVFFADSQHYTPRYLTSDIGALATGGLMKNAGPGFDGALGFTSSEYVPPGTAENPGTGRCRAQYNAIPGVKPVPAGADSALPQICAMVDILKRGLTGAGKDLNPRSFVQAIQRIGSISGLPGTSTGSFGPGKTDYNDGLRPVRWSTRTHRWSAAGPPIPAGGG